MADVAETIVTATAQELSRTATQRGYRLHEERGPLARAAAAAALRTLAVNAGLDYYNGGDLQDLAEKIERGGR